MSERNVIHNFSHEAMGTRFWIRIADEDRSYAERAAESIFYAIDELDFQVDARHDSGPMAGVNGMHMGRYISDHDRLIAQKLAYVLCGGDLSYPQLVSEQYLLDLEREAFLSLCGERKTLERIQHMLKTGKALRN
jgi:3-hydroxyacyl-CoA dehydrogenase